MVVMGHRRISINGVSLDDLSTTSSSWPLHDPLITNADSVSTVDEKVLKNGLRRRLRKANQNNEEKSSNQNAEPSIEPSLAASDQILMVDTSNLTHHEFKPNQEMKALTNEIIKTIRDIISLNPLYR